GHQGLDISYNVLNFPKEITNDEGMTATYTYLSDGIKHSVSTHDGLGKLYRGSFVYDGGSASLESIATPEGRLVSTTDGILDLWYAKDYLGNARSVIDLASGVIEENDYLPFGTRIQDDNQTTLSDNRWRYANKEEQASLVGGSCNLIDFGARNYDPWSARWTSIDPMAEKFVGMSPYNYCAGNPVMLVDPDGACVGGDMAIRLTPIVGCGLSLIAPQIIAVAPYALPVVAVAGIGLLVSGDTPLDHEMSRKYSPGYDHQGDRDTASEIETEELKQKHRQSLKDSGYDQDGDPEPNPHFNGKGSRISVAVALLLKLISTCDNPEKPKTMIQEKDAGGAGEMKFEAPAEENKINK
ncbi:MAG: RHS repeat-associated core domain-containing protein, partial [Bacteroidales bacterium]|nr:RHS repeat-associated core domain-containing protein [Bacteroidales bacterium]